MINCPDGDVNCGVLATARRRLSTLVNTVYNMTMSKSSTFAIGILSGLLVGAVVVALIAYRNSSFCPVCGGKLVAKDGSLSCSSCGVKIRLGEP
jgi:uncharacterized Zn finger protein (UPF0148 family)